MTRAATTLSAAAAALSVMALGCAHHDRYEEGRGICRVERRVIEPHNCPDLPPDSPLRLLESKELMDGCPSDVALRPSSSQEVDVLFTCPASLVPVIILRGHGHTPFRNPDVVDQESLTDELDQTKRHFLHQIDIYGPGNALRPFCAADRGVGLNMSIYDYAKVDAAVDGLRQWIRTNDLDVEMVIRLVPNPDPGLSYVMSISP